MGDDSRIIGKIKTQITRFSKRVSVGFPKPTRRFVREMIYGIQASQDTKLSSIGRALGEEIALKKTEERLSHHLGMEGMGQTINEVIVEHSKRRMHPDTLIVVDPTDIRKTYARKMPYLATVRDGSTGEMVPGYWS